MAASNFFLYNKAIARICKGIINLSTSTIVAVPLKSSYTPSTASHSAFAQISGHQSTATGAVVAAITLASKTFTGSGGDATKFDSADISGFSAGGDTFATKYIALYARSASDGTIDNPLLGWMDVNTSASTGIEASQLNITVAAAGWFKVRTNQ